MLRMTMQVHEHPLLWQFLNFGSYTYGTYSSKLLNPITTTSLCLLSFIILYPVSRDDYERLTR